MKVIKVLLFFMLLLCVPFQTYASQSNEESTNRDLILTLLTPYISKEIEKYYDKTLKYPPTYAPWFGTEITVKRTEPRRFEFLVTVKAEPYVGAHNSVGVDEITFLVSVTDGVKTIKYVHLKDYKLPPHLSNYYR
ncbi:DUF3888 domain-containing protein [Paenibacillus sp. GCM10027628]|uniref:DUF3888 domain-containing protein n=1 Tax=Paenibacillus sp. GCM10027628 TaxID=3273413 RepID=UPI003643010E